MFNLSNSLSLLRAPLALLFLAENVTLRITAIVLAMCTDALDGYLARRLRATSHIGTILDPAMDKFFVFFGLGVLIMEGKLEVWQACTMVSRDFALCIFGLYLAFSGKWQAHEFKAIRWGKATTILQFFVLIALTLGFHLPQLIFPLFILFGLLALFELLRIRKTPSPEIGAKP
jgi:CDP-diacylglycerol---glycerol-3-phosphate 3-phosphatidyltransferase